MQLLWFLPTHGDGRYLAASTGGRALTFDYLRQVAMAADTLGYYGVLLPTGRSCEDSWVVASAVAPFTKQLKYLVALRPGLVSPDNGRALAASLDRVTDGRLLINVVTGGDPVELKADGLWLKHDERYELTAEFLQRMAPASCRADRPTSKASTCMLKMHAWRFRRCRNPIRRSGSADRRRPGSRSRPTNATCI